MKISKKFIKEFNKIIPLEIHCLDDEIMTVGIKWGFCGYAREIYGKQTVKKVLDLLETNKEYQKLLEL